MAVKGNATDADDGPDHVLALLGHLLDGLRRDVQRGIRASSPAAPLRSSQLRLLSLTPAGGMRVTDLADRVGMTKQALGEFATALEERGLLESVRDPADRRVRILRPTDRGRRAVAEGTAVIEAVEARWRERLGPREWDALRGLLRRAAAAGPSPPAASHPPAPPTRPADPTHRPDPPT